MRIAQRVLLAVTLLAMAAALPAVTAAAPARVALHQVSGPTPFPTGCPGAAFDDTMIPGQELEPSIAVNRAHPSNVVAAWIQDAGPDSERTDITAASRDGGRRWTRSTLPGPTKCEGGTADSVAVAAARGAFSVISATRAGIAPPQVHPPMANGVTLAEAAGSPSAARRGGRPASWSLRRARAGEPFANAGHAT